MRSGYKHYKNSPVLNRCFFVTTTCLNFAHCFESDQAKNIMSASLLDDVRHYGAILHAFVVMGHHIHFLAYPPEEKTVSWFIDRIKSNGARRVIPFVTERAKRDLQEQSGLNERVFWKVGFRSLPIARRETFYQKAKYVHRNPVRGGICEEASAYRWSSAQLFDQGLWNSEEGIKISRDLVESLAPYNLLDLTLVRQREIGNSIGDHPSILPTGLRVRRSGDPSTRPSGLRVEKNDSASRQSD